MKKLDPVISPLDRIPCQAPGATHPESTIDFKCAKERVELACDRWFARQQIRHVVFDAGRLALQPYELLPEPFQLGLVLEDELLRRRPPHLDIMARMSTALGRGLIPLRLTFRRSRVIWSCVNVMRLGG